MRFSMLALPVVWLIFLFSLRVTHAQSECPMPPRLVTGDKGRVTYTDGSPLNVRDAAARSGALVTTLAEGATFDVVAGPVCADGIQWFQIAARCDRLGG